MLMLAGGSIRIDAGGDTDKGSPVPEPLRDSPWVRTGEAASRLP